MTKYFLHVDLIVAVKNVDEFEKRVDKFLADGGFGRLDDNLRSEFVLGLKSEEFKYTGYETYEAPTKGVERNDARIVEGPSKGGPGLSVVRYVHLWRIPSPDLAPAMSKSADDKDYVKLDDLVVREIQNLVVPVPRFPSTAEPRGSGLLRVSKKFQSNRLGTYLFKSGALTTALEAEGWHLLYQLQNVTGPLNTVTEFWLIPEGATHLASEPERALNKLHPNIKESLVTGDEGITELPQAEVRELLYVPGYFRAHQRRLANG